MQSGLGAKHLVASILLIFAAGRTVADVVQVQPFPLEQVFGPLHQLALSPELKDPQEKAALDSLRSTLGSSPEAPRDDEGKPTGKLGYIGETIGPQGLIAETSLSRPCHGRSQSLDLMQILLSNFGRLPGMNPRFPEDAAEFPGREGPAPRPRVNKTSIVERIGVGQPDVGFISVDFEVIVVPELNETRRRNASWRSSMKHRFLPRNRSAYVVLDTYPVQMSEDSNGRGFGSQSMNRASADSNSNGGVLKLSLLALFMVMACGVSCVLGTSLPILWRRHQADRTSVWVTKTGNLFRLRGGPDAAPHLPTIHRSEGDWCA
ncbi:unnamed protein product [Ixodes persulcatus]